MRPGPGLLALLAGVAGCGGDTAPPPDQAATRDPSPPDSLVLVTPDSTRIFLSAGLPDTAADGSVCQSHSIVLERDGARKVVPLLYTLEPPTLLDDSTLLAVRAKDCGPGDRYRVGLRTGLPVRAP